MTKLYLLEILLQLSAIIVSVGVDPQNSWHPTVIYHPASSTRCMSWISYNRALTCRAPSCVTLSDDIFVGKVTAASDAFYAWKIKQIFKSILLGHKSCCYLQSQSQIFSLETGFREKRELESIWYSQAAFTKLKWLMFVFSITVFSTEENYPYHKFWGNLWFLTSNTFRATILRCKFPPRRNLAF